MNQRAKTAMAAALACVTLVTSAVAEESPYRKSLTERSKKEGFGRAEAKTLSVVVTSDRGKTAERLRKEASSGTLGKLLALSFDKPSQNGKKTVSFVAEQGYLQVYADGSRFRLRGDLGKVKPTEANGGKERIEIHRLEKIARDYVQGPLKEFIGLQDAEALTFLGSRYFRQGGGSVAGDKGKEYLVANIAILGREIDGIPVVEAGRRSLYGSPPRRKSWGSMLTGRNTSGERRLNPCSPSKSFVAASRLHRCRSRIPKK